MTMPILTTFCAFELLAAAAVMPRIAMLWAIHLLNMAGLRWVVGAVSRRSIQNSCRLQIAVGLLIAVAVVWKFDFPASV
jgi:hypothetical protein